MKKNLFKKLAAGFLAATLTIASLTGCGKAKTEDKVDAADRIYKTVDEIKEAGKINIGDFSRIC